MRFYISLSSGAKLGNYGTGTGAGKSPRPLNTQFGPISPHYVYALSSPALNFNSLDYGARKKVNE